MDVRNQKLEQQRKIMEQKIKRKRQSSAMIQASDTTNTSAKLRSNSGSRRELHGYDGPLQFTMSDDNNPDQVIPVLSSNDNVHVTEIEDITDSPPNDLMDIEDEESTPVASTPNNGNMPVNPIADQTTLINNQLNMVFDNF